MNGSRGWPAGSSIRLLELADHRSLYLALHTSENFLGRFLSGVYEIQLGPEHLARAQVVRREVDRGLMICGGLEQLHMSRWLMAARLDQASRLLIGRHKSPRLGENLRPCRAGHELEQLPGRLGLVLRSSFGDHENDQATLILLLHLSRYGRYIPGEALHIATEIVGQA